MKTSKWKTIRSFFVLGIFVLALSASGCAVLTPSQVKEVKRFADATERYDTVPGSVIEAYADLRMRERLFSAAGMIPGPTALSEIESALKAKRHYQTQAEQANHALQILDEYAQLLVTLTADDFSEDLQQEARNLGTQLDKGIGKYNEQFGKELKPFGGPLAAGVRGVGGLYIKRHQTLVLREAVINADPVIDEMATAVTGLLELFLPNGTVDGFILDSERNLKQIFDANLQGSMAKEPLFATLQTALTLELSHDAINLAEKARISITKLRQAHTDLKNNLQKKKKIKTAIETVKVFADEVKAANNLRKKINKG